MIAEDSQPSAYGQQPQPRHATASDALRTPVVDTSSGTAGTQAAGQSDHGAGDGMARAAAALKPRMRGWLHAGVFPLALAGGIVLIAVSRSAAAVAACSVYAVRL
ncbi:hypothetical protein OHB41_00770 [Streptomyces sp. NBC_01571]|uniref:hypothetical protein n=1 Tax=Streptomyces sp. NBC_01571 TaxID=2975883 RepID=UPI002258AF96|nr:hypothetical protein [Streptomyces sp. NBC_01571]MCX4571764.1 hypothetical protein [Streptomyces sp. NBC_01571]